MNKSFIYNIPLDVWSCVSQHLNNVEKLEFFWFLWNEKIVRFNSVIEAFEQLSINIR